MSNQNLKPLQFLLPVILIFTTAISFGQIRTSLMGGSGIGQLEAYLSKKELLEEVRDSLEVLKKRALVSNNEVLQVRCLYDLMRIRDMRTEDSLYFRNSAFMDTILRDQKASAKMKALVYILQAQRLFGFNHRYLKFNAAAYRIKNSVSNYAALSPVQRDSLMYNDLDAALKLNPFQGDVSSLVWLSSNPDVFLFTPKFGDIIFSERINLAPRKYDDYYNETKQMVSWASLPSPTFKRILDSLVLASGEKEIFRSYKRWLNFRKDDLSANMYIESLLRKYMFLSTQADSAGNKSYTDYLVTSATSPHALIKAHAVYQLCLLWNAQGKAYVNFYDRYQYPTGGHFDKKYQYMSKKALELYEQNKPVIAQYPVLDKVLQLMVKQILSRGIKVEMEDKFIPGEAIPIKAMYKNAGMLFYRIVAVNESDDDRYIPLSTLLGKMPLEDNKFILPLPADNNSHAVYLKLPALPKGAYHLLFSHKPITSSSDSIYNIRFRVTSVIMANTDERLYVLDRKTGQPLPGAMIKLFKNKLPVSNGSTIKVNAKGYAIVSQNKADSIVTSYKNDTLGQPVNIQVNNVRDDHNIYDKDEYDDLEDFYDDKLKMQVFTDRGIYRPGQTVHYKIIFLTKNPRTGNTMLFNAENVGSKFFHNRLTKWIKENKARIRLDDPFGHTIDSARVAINDFGSYAGSFVLPKAAATGEWNIDGTPETDYGNNGRFKVEEYKRPTIELAMGKQTKMLFPGQPFTIKLKLRSYTGAQLSNVPVTYKLQRYGMMPDKKVNGIYKDVTLADTDGYTDKNGLLNIRVDDSLLAKYPFDRDIAYNYTYYITAKATDLTGETSEIDERINISTQPVRINMNVAKIYDRNAIPPINIRTTNDFEGDLSRPVNIKLYQVSDPDRFVWKEVDQWYYHQSEWNSWFPELKVPEKQQEKKRVLMFDTILNTGAFQKLILPRKNLSPGFYELDAECRDNEKMIGKATYNFKVFDSQSSEVPADNIDYLPANSVKPGGVITWYTSGKNDTYTIYQVLYATGSGQKVIKNIYQESNEKKGIRKWTYRVPVDANGHVLITSLSVYNNALHQHQQTVYIFKPVSESPEIIVERYRKIMAPGAKETFTVSIKTKNDNVAAELMTTMYDASLDKLAQHEWRLPEKEYDRQYLYSNWNRYTSTITQGNNGQNEPFDLSDSIDIQGVPGASQSYLLQGRVAGLSVTQASGLNEVVVVGYGTQLKRDITGSVATVMIRGTSSLQDYKQPLIVLDGVVYTGDLKNIPVSSITEAMVLKGADGTAIYGARASEGVLIISTKGPIILPESQEPVIKIRKDFNETAFFFPQVHISADGYYHFSFTMPETATEWKWKMMAHTRDAQFAYLERKLQTQLNLMVQPNMPRLLYQGDQLKLQSRISNLDTNALKGIINCKIENAVTGQDITTQLVHDNTQNFSLAAKSTTAASFQLAVPKAFTDPLKVVISVAGGDASDAEEHIIPILSTNVFTRQSVPVKFDKNASITVPSIKLPDNSSLYGASISIQQKPQASLINALPWLANYSFDCAEQTFNKMRAEVTAVRLMQKEPNVRKAFLKVEQAINVDRQESTKLPDELAGESLPWLDIFTKVSKQQKQLFKLLDTGATKENINAHLERIFKLQQEDGGLSWFEGSKSSLYISAYVLAGFGQLRQQGWIPDKHYADKYSNFISRLFKYNAKTVCDTGVGNYDSYQLYALSYWIDLSDISLNAKTESDLSAAWTNASKLDLGGQALLIINTCRFVKNDSKLYQKSLHLLENIRQQAISDAENGIRWKAVADGEDLERSSEETVALLNEAFSFDKDREHVSSGILHWLLTTKQEQHWQTTKATAAAIGILQQQPGGAFGENQFISAELGGKQLIVSNDLLDGIPEAFIRLTKQPAQIVLQQQGSNSRGALTWYYFSDGTHLDTLNKAIKVIRKYYKYDKNKGLVELSQDAILKPGDDIHVKLTIETATQVKFVHVNDPRAAAFEPKESESGYRYGQGVSYYQSVRDTGLDLFVESIPRGVSTIEYDLNVAMSGNFVGGPTTLQCMYQPSATAYSNSYRFAVE